MMVDRDMIKEC